VIAKLAPSAIYQWYLSLRSRDMDIARIFWSGRSQAVRLPKGYRFDGGEVRIRRRGMAVILEPIATDWSWLDKLAGSVDRDFEEAALEQPGPQERKSLDFFE
jgi:antitoxin VapB